MQARVRLRCVHGPSVAFVCKAPLSPLSRVAPAPRRVCSLFASLHRPEYDGRRASRRLACARRKQAPAAALARPLPRHATLKSQNNNRLAENGTHWVNGTGHPVIFVKMPSLKTLYLVRIMTVLRVEPNRAAALRLSL